MYKRIGAISFVFGFLMFVPVVLNLFSKGYVVLPLFSFEHSFFVGHLFVPKTIGITAEGLKSLSVLSLRVCNSVSLCMLVFYTTPFSAIVKSLRLFRVPVVFLFTINMTFKFVFILAQAIEETYMALKMRLVSKMKTNDTTTIVVGRILYTFQKSWQRYELVFQSMLARGFTGNIVALKSGSLTVADWLFLLASFTLAAFLLISH